MKLFEKSFMRLMIGAIMTAATMHSGSALAQQKTAGQNTVTAIDILLDPDATMIQHAQAANARLLENYPRGFSLGGEHAPHVSVLQRYVNTADLDEVYAAVGKVFLKENPTGWKLRAAKYAYIPDEPLGLGNIVLEPTADLLRLQQELIDAVAPFIVPTGSAAAFVTTPRDPNIVAPLIHYVAVFVPEHSGQHYVPHVTIGLGTIDFLNSMVSAPFHSLTFSPAGASVYHLGNYGTAMRKLHSFTFNK